MFSRNFILSMTLIMAFGLRVGVAIGLQQFVNSSDQGNFYIDGDADFYWRLGKQIAAGKAYQIEDELRLRQVVRMPGFPAMLAVAIKVKEWLNLEGEAFFVARILLAGIGTIACWLVYVLGRQLFDETTGLIAAGLTTVSPIMTGFSVVLLTETVFAACMLASLIVLAKVAQTDFTAASRFQTVGLPVFAGVLIAAATYVRSSWLLVGPIFFILLVVLSTNRRQALLRGSLVLMGLAVALAPWIVRNYQVTDKVVVTTLWLGPSLYDGLNPSATGASNMDWFDRENLMAKMTEYQVDRHYRGKAIEFAINNPVRTVQLAGIKFFRYWKPWPNHEMFSTWWQCLAVALFFIPVVVLAAHGWWVTRYQYWNWLLTVGPIIYFSALHVIFVGSLRYRLPAEYSLCVMSAIGIQVWIRSRRGGKANRNQSVSKLLTHPKDCRSTLCCRYG